LHLVDVHLTCLINITYLLTYGCWVALQVYRCAAVVHVATTAIVQAPVAMRCRVDKTA